MTNWQDQKVKGRVGGASRFGSRENSNIEKSIIKEDPAVTLTNDAVKLQGKDKILGDSGWTMVGSGTQEWKIPSVSEKKFASFPADYGIKYLIDTSASVVVTLPAAKKNAVVIIKDYLGQAVVNPIQVKARGAELIDGITSQYINADYWSLTLWSDGSNWFKQNSVDGTMLNQVTIPDQWGGAGPNQYGEIDWNLGDTFKIAVDAGKVGAGSLILNMSFANIQDKVIILAVQNTSATVSLDLNLPAAIGNSSLSSAMPVTVDPASWSIFTWFNLNAGAPGSGNVFVSGVENLS